MLPTTPSEILPIARELRAMHDTLLALARRQQAQEDRLDTVEDVVEELR